MHLAGRRQRADVVHDPGEPALFAAQISTAYDPYHAFKDLKLGEANFATMLKTMPGWFFAGLTEAPAPAVSARTTRA